LGPLLAQFKPEKSLAFADKGDVSKMLVCATAFLHQALEGAITGPIDVLIPTQGRHRMV
jgi:hypothetical protein